jgi:predicted DNA-binding transcriptional regulator YafY
MGRSSRLFEIIQILRHSAGAVSARQLAQSLEVSQRTIYRDMVALQAMRTPVEGEAGVGYVLREGFDLPPLMFTAEEVEAIAVGLSLIARTGDADLVKAAEQVSWKIADILPCGGEARIEGSPLHVSRWHAIPPATVEYRMIRRSIREERKLRLSYCDAYAHDSDRTVRPLALVYYIENAILAAWCELRGDFRHFRLDRISSCAALEGRFAGEGERLRREWRAGVELFSS